MRTPQIKSFKFVIFVFLLLLFLPAVSAQSTDLYDLSTIRTFNLTFKQSGWWNTLVANYAAKKYIRADLVVDNVLYKDVGVRFRGNSSYKAIPANSMKKPFKISMDEFVPGQNLLGFNTINLNNGFRDPTFTREVVATWFYRQFMPCPRANYARLRINNQDYGVYINIQQINKDLLKENCVNLDGNRYRGERTPGYFNANAALVWLGANQSIYKYSYQLKNEQPTNPWVDLVNMINVLNNTSYTSLATKLPGVLDVDNALRYLVGCNILPAMDSYIWSQAHNFYLFNDLFHNRFILLPWDLNACFGGDNSLTVSYKKNLDPFYKNNTSRPLLFKLMSQGPWRQRYLAYFRSMLSGGFDWHTLGGMVAKAQQIVVKDYTSDPIKLYTVKQFNDNVTQNVNLYITNRWQTIPGLKPFIEGRRQFLLNHQSIKGTPPVITYLVGPAVPVTAQDQVWITVKVTATATPGAVELHHRHCGPYLAVTMHDDGKHHDGAPGDGIYGAAIPPGPALSTVEYFVTATSSPATGGAMTVYPPAGGHTPERYRVWTRIPKSGVQISEFMARNKKFVKDPLGDNDDWLELVNTSTVAVDVSGYYLTDDYLKPTLWKIPSGNILPPGGTLVIWLDDEPLQGPLHATFKLDGGGEEVALFASDGKTLVDGVIFGAQQQDISMGRIAGYPGTWFSFPIASFNQPNRPNPCGFLNFNTVSSNTNPLQLTHLGWPRVGSSFSASLVNGPVSGAGVLGLAAKPAIIPLGQLGTLLLDPLPVFFISMPTGSSGTATLQLNLPNNPVMIGGTVYLQAIAFNATSGGFSNGMMTTFCP